MNLFKSLVQAKDKCILDDSLFYDTIGHSDSLFSFSFKWKSENSYSRCTRQHS